MTHSAPQRRHITFDHDGHRFEAAEEVTRAAGSMAEPAVHWVVRMDGAPALEFRGPYPYRDDAVRERVLEWYALQRPRAV